MVGDISAHVVKDPARPVLPGHEEPALVFVQTKSQYSSAVIDAKSLEFFLPPTSRRGREDQCQDSNLGKTGERV